MPSPAVNRNFWDPVEAYTAPAPCGTSPDTSTEFVPVTVYVTVPAQAPAAHNAAVNRPTAHFFMIPMPFRRYPPRRRASPMPAAPRPRFSSLYPPPPPTSSQVAPVTLRTTIAEFRTIRWLPGNPREIMENIGISPCFPLFLWGLGAPPPSIAPPPAIPFSPLPHVGAADFSPLLSLPPLPAPPASPPASPPSFPCPRSGFPCFPMSTSLPLPSRPFLPFLSFRAKSTPQASLPAPLPPRSAHPYPGF